MRECILPLALIATSVDAFAPTLMGGLAVRALPWPAARASCVGLRMQEDAEKKPSGENAGLCAKANAVAGMATPLPQVDDDYSQELEEAVQKAAHLIHNAASISVFTGAGISVDSGIPDFRSPGGLWDKYDPSYYCNYEVFKQSPHLFWTMAREIVLTIHEGQGGSIDDALRSGTFLTAPPNAGHDALVQLELLGKSVTVITQNIDGLHKTAGSSRVVELHGTDRTATCITCRNQVEQKDIVRQWAEMPEAQRLLGRLADDGFVPRCQICNGVLKADVTFFGEALPAGAMSRAVAAVMASSVCIVVGTSLQVAPANMVPSMVKARFGKVVVCNLDESGRSQADVFIKGSSTVTIPKLVAAVHRLQASGAPRSMCSVQ